MSAAANHPNASHFSRFDVLSALAVVLIWGLNFVVMKWGLRDVSPMLLGCLRYMCASLPFVVFIKRPNVPWRFVVGYGVAQGLGQFGFLFMALQLGMTAGMASVVMQSQAFVTLLLAHWLLGERAQWAHYAGLLCAGIGLAMIASAHGSGAGQMTLIGFLLTLCAASMWACSNIVARMASIYRAHHPDNEKNQGGYDPLAFLVWSSLLPIIPFFIFAVKQDSWQIVSSQLQGLSLRTVLAVLYLGLLATVLAYTLWTRLLQRHPTGRVAPYSLLVPIIGLVAAWVLLGEQPTLLQLAGTVVVLLGLVINMQGQTIWRKLRN
ncbi:MAG TPA: EamA family transporter [Burkholderiaceae bacterium]|nr:EamA family transporter [Burkholderiaceae bacterium]